ncbi:undecaprenyl/decaprenyl-phosphate alpha-N-acetylglucosaminyl 1-phosphate transferase [Flavihumibacter sp. R14]|nr:undecaprenyl/decaprenyl-phosphate alpha-N-acetylglucosaminyl 1-phosphate transferase [Flavihumibacter soli]
MNITWLEGNPLHYFYILIFSFLLVFLAIPSIIHIADKLQVFDNNKVARKNHRHGVSRLGGIAVFCSLILTSLLFADFINLDVFNYLLTAFILIFAVGLKDDLWGVNPSTKFFIQLLTALTVVLLADIRISNMQGVLGIWALPYWLSVGFSVLLIIFLTNSFNLIDGIDGLVGITALVVSLTFGLFFAYMGQASYACIAFILTGGSIGFLRFNMSPARIFMGDAGSLLIGLVAAILAIKFIELNIPGTAGRAYFASAPAIAMAVLIGPIFDVIRVFVIRLLRNSSPFIADNNHTHHRLLRLGFNHRQTTLILMSFSNLLLSAVIYFRELGSTVLITFLFLSCVVFNTALTFALNIRERKFKRTLAAEAGELIRRFFSKRTDAEGIEGL